MYLDYNATTPLHPDALRDMRPFLEAAFGNASSAHSLGRSARTALDQARDRLAQLIGAHSKEIIFTSGGTESNNLALFGTVPALRSKGRHILTCATEHHSILHPCRRLMEEGFDVTFLPVDSEGQLDPGRLARSFRPDTILVSIMSANNETGVCHPVSEIGALCRERKVPFHCDAIQSFGKERVNVDTWRVDLLSMAAHKFYGPKGAGLLYVRSKTPILPLILGGSQENTRRPGTENVAAIVGMASAASAAASGAEAENRRLFALTEKLWSLLDVSIPGIRRNGHAIHRLGNTLSVSVQGCSGEDLIMGLDLEGLAVSSGSACMVGSVQPSHVLAAMGADEKRFRGTVRFSLGSDSKEEHLPLIAERMAQVVERLRIHS